MEIANCSLAVMHSHFHVMKLTMKEYAIDNYDDNCVTIEKSIQKTFDQMNERVAGGGGYYVFLPHYIIHFGQWP